MRRALVTLIVRHPWTLCFAVAIVAVNAEAFEGPQPDRWTEALDLRRGPVLSGEIWRLVTGQVVHFTPEHFCLGILAFMGLGCVCERGLGSRYAASVGGAALMVGMALLIIPPVGSYRGLSGLDSAMFVIALHVRLRDARQAGDRILALYCIGGAAMFTGKMLYESVTGAALFCTTLSRVGAHPLPLAHLVGALAGIVVGAWARRDRRSSGRPAEPGCVPGPFGCRMNLTMPRLWIRRASLGRNVGVTVNRVARG